MKAWIFRSRADVQIFWLKVREVPRRTAGRTKKQYERYHLGLYLLALADHGFLSCPLQVEEGESPDFVLTRVSGDATGLEVTRATDEELQRWMTRTEKENPEGCAALVSPLGYAGDQLEEEWCKVVRGMVEKKLALLPGFRPMMHHDLLIPDDTRMGAGDRRKALSILSPWARQLKREHPSLGKISVGASLDILYDVGDEDRIFPYVEWTTPQLEASEGEEFSDRAEHAGRVATQEAIRRQDKAKSPVYFIDGSGRLVKETPEGRRFEVRVEEDGAEVTVQELSIA